MDHEEVISHYKYNLGALEGYLSTHYGKEIVVPTACLEYPLPHAIFFGSYPFRLSFHFNINEEEGYHPTSVYVKTRRLYEKPLAAVVQADVFKKEILAYTDIIPALNDHICTPLRVPAYLHGDMNQILIQDLRSRPFREITKNLATDWNLIWSPIQEMAKLHAASIIMEHDDEENFVKLVRSITDTPSNSTLPFFQKQINALENVLKLLLEVKDADTAKQRKFIEGMMRQPLWDKVRNIINHKAPVRVISHGSIWITNYLYRDDMVSVLDWQNVKYTSPAVDLGSFLYTNLDTEFLKKNKKDLLQFYLLHLHQYIYDSCESRWVTEELENMLESLDIFWLNNELRRCLLNSFLMALWITPVFSWSLAVYEQNEIVGSIENMSVSQRLMRMTPYEKDRLLKLTQLYLQESGK